MLAWGQGTVRKYLSAILRFEVLRVWGLGFRV